MTCLHGWGRQAVLSLWLWSACSDDPKSAPDDRDDPSVADAGIDASSRDAAREASAPMQDARVPADARVPDAQLPDARAPDARIPDAQALDAQVLDARVPDAQVVDAGGSFAAARIVDPPSYLGTDGSSSDCTKSFRSAGFAPVDGAKHPLFLYFVGTEGTSADESSKFDAKAPLAVANAMARRGFVALSIEYDNLLFSFFTSKVGCLYQAPESALARACALPNVDCALGIATWGHSQGGLIAHAAANYDSRVRAVWTTGYSGMDGNKLAKERFRAVNGEADTLNSPPDISNKTAGISAADCPGQGPDQCLRPDGSGWIVVRKSACELSNADHCWFNKAGCSTNTETLEPNWVNPGSTAPFALEANADWVASTVAR
jgi:hypothetical protein